MDKGQLHDMYSKHEHSVPRIMLEVLFLCWTMFVFGYSVYHHHWIPAVIWTLFVMVFIARLYLRVNTWLYARKLDRSPR